MIVRGVLVAGTGSLPAPSQLLPMLGAGAVIGAGIMLLIDSLMVLDRNPAAGDDHCLAARIFRAVLTFRRRLLIAVLAAVVTLLFTRWPVAAITAGFLAAVGPALFGGAADERRAAEKVEGLAIWTESLRDTIAGAVGLEQAIMATADAAPASIAADLRVMADRLRVRVPLVEALNQFAADLDDASADLMVAALLLNSKLRGPGLRQVLTSLAESARAELEMRGRISAGRASTRRSVQIVMIVTVAFVLLLVVFNPSYVEPYNHPLGQLVLAIVILLFGIGFIWLRRLSAYDLPARFLAVTSGGPVASGGPGSAEGPARTVARTSGRSGPVR